MGLEVTNQVDAIGVDKLSGKLSLAIIDSWDWSDEEGHLTALGAKLGAYLDYLEGDDFQKRHAAAKERTVCIELIARYPLPRSAEAWISEAAKTTSEAGVELRVRREPPPGPSHLTT